MADDGKAPEMEVVNLFDPELMSNPQPKYDEIRSRCPVARSAITNSPIISRYEDVMWALRHPEIFSSEMGELMALGTERPMIPQQIDPPKQTKYRKLLDPQFSRKRMLAIEDLVRADARALIDRFIDAGECEFNSAFAIPLPCNAFLRLMGLPSEDLELFLELKDGIIRPRVEASDIEGAKRARTQTGKRIYAYFEELIDKRSIDPQSDLMSSLVNAEIDGEKLTRNDILDVCFLLLLAGLDTVTATLGCNMTYLANNPEQQARLRDDPALIPGAIEELMRWETPVTAVPRVVKQDVTVSGFELKQGELVTLLLGAANLDDAEFSEPRNVDFERESNRHIAFGGGTHRCLGSHLARMELRVAMEELHKRLPAYWIKPGEKPSFSPGIREVKYLPLVWDAGAR